MAKFELPILPPTFNDWLRSQGIPNKRVWLIRHSDSRLKSTTVYDPWADHLEVFEKYQSVQRKVRRFYPATYVTSFVVNYRKETVFVGLYWVEGVRRVSGVDRPALAELRFMRDDHIHEMRKLRGMEPYEGKLVIDWGRSQIAIKQFALTHNKPIVTGPE
jgi:hypothetical protein